MGKFYLLHKQDFDVLSIKSIKVSKLGSLSANDCTQRMHDRHLKVMFFTAFVGSKTLNLLSEKA